MTRSLAKHETPDGSIRIEPIDAQYGLDRSRALVALSAPLGPPPLQLLNPLCETLEELLALDRQIYSGNPSLAFGLELKAIFDLPEWTGSGPNPRTLLMRPATEPVIFSYWDRFRSWSFEDESAISLASCLYGRSIEYRRGPAATFADKSGRRTFPDPAIARNWLSSIQPPPAQLNAVESLSAALHAMALVILNHPFEDGNGRFGRAVFNGVLARSSGLSAPILALGPYSYINWEQILHGWIELGTTNHWSSIVNAYADVLSSSLEFNRRHVAVMRRLS